MIIDSFSFNAEYWKKKTEKDFMDEYSKDIHRPASMSKDEWKIWLKDAYVAIKHNSTD